MELFPPRHSSQEAKLAGLTTISITDHDHTGAIDEAIAVGERLGIEVIPGVELSTNVGSLEIHLLGYFFDHRNRKLQDYLALFRAERLKRAERIVEKLNGLSIPLTLRGGSPAGGPGIGRPASHRQRAGRGRADRKLPRSVPEVHRVRQAGIRREVPDLPPRRHCVDLAKREGFRSLHIPAMPSTRECSARAHQRRR